MAAASTPIRLGFLGGGQMAEALIAGILNEKVPQSSDIIVADPLNARREYLEKTYTGVRATENSMTVVENADVIVIAVKPQSFQALCTQLKGTSCASGKVFASIMAGVTLETLSQQLPDSCGVDIVRVMPNTPALVGAGASAYVVKEPILHPDLALPRIEFVNRIFSAIGTCSRVPSEAYIDAVTGLSGSGPAYVYMMISSLSDGGVKNGLPRDLANELAAQTVMGAAKMVIERKMHPEVLKNHVESPGGTTIAGTAKLEEKGFRSAVIEAVTAATNRSKELGTKK